MVRRRSARVASLVSPALLAAASGCGRVGFAAIADGAPAGGDVSIAAPAGALLAFHLDEAAGTTATAEDGTVASLVGAVSWTDGARGNALEFAAGGSLDLAPDSRLVLAGAITLSVWYRLDLVPPMGQCTPVLAHAGPSTTDPADNALYSIVLSPPDVVLYAEYMAQLAIPTAAAVPATAFSTATWHHLVVTRDPAAGTVAFYVDGGPAILATPSANPDGGTAGFLRIGADITPGGAGCGSFPGSLDELYLYPRALSAAEARSLFELR